MCHALLTTTLLLRHHHQSSQVPVCTSSFFSYPALYSNNSNRNQASTWIGHSRPRIKCITFGRPEHQRRRDTDNLVGRRGMFVRSSRWLQAARAHWHWWVSMLRLHEPRRISRREYSVSLLGFLLEKLPTAVIPGVVCEFSRYGRVASCEGKYWFRGHLICW